MMPGNDRKAVAIAPHILEAAAEWLVVLNASTASDEDRAACEHWCQSNPEHQRAWVLAEALMNKLGSLPTPQAMSVLDRPIGADRRAILGSVGRLAVLLAIIPMGWAVWRLKDGNSLTADHRTAIGERREVQLADGSRITINTASEIDVRFDMAQRLIMLRAGEILVQTAKDPIAISTTVSRPFRVNTLQGRMEALGTRFTVRQFDNRTHVAVLEGAVRIEAGQGNEGKSFLLNAGQQTSFSTSNIDPMSQLDAGTTAWTQGMLLADKMRLADVAAELARYRHGMVRCDPAIAELLVSGAFPVGDHAATERALTMLVSTYPLEARLYLRGLWVNLQAR